MDTKQAAMAVDNAGKKGLLTAGAVKNIRAWLTEPRYAAYADQVVHHVSEEQWKQLDDVFWTVIPFGTGGRRGRMYPIGSNAINERTIGESARGLAEYVIKNQEGGRDELSCAIAYDTRHQSPEFARLCAETMVAAGFKVYFLDDYRSTPELSFLVRYKNCSCGIMVTASHNPPSDNAVKCYWSTGGQILPPHDKGVIEQVMNVTDVPRTNFDEAVADGRVSLCLDETDKAFIAAVAAQRFDGPRDLGILYSPLHGVGASAVLPVLAADGFSRVELYGPNAEPNGDFPNVPGHVSNPENPEVFAAPIQLAQEKGLDLVLATDPDCDRVGCAAPLTGDRRGEWATFNGNQIAALLTEFVLASRKRRGTLSPENFLVKTLVTTELVRRIGDSYGVKTFGNLLVGFKWIGGTMDEQGPERFVFGAEESHGYLVGQYARDKDASVAAMLLAECAAEAKADGKSLHDQLAAIYWQHGYHAERLLNQTMTGSEGMQRMKNLMMKFRAEPPAELAGIKVTQVLDYANGVCFSLGGKSQPLDGPHGDMVILELAAEGNYVAIRPSGTEPKVKFYMFTYTPPEMLSSLPLARQQAEERLGGLQNALKAFAETV
ncbi:MAG: phospho-sugar mutase [Pirellulaceae bacterium]|nr:phospho-sugar mutase [Planctomycetales bacterium]